VRAHVGRRLVPLSTFAIGCIAVGIVFGIAVFAFNAYATHLRRDATALIALTAGIVAPQPGADAVEAARAVAPRLADPALLLVFVDARHRVTVLDEREGAVADRETIVVRPRADLSAEPQASGSFAHLTLGIATIFGLQTVRARTRDLDIYAQVNNPVFVSDVGEFVPAFAGALALAIALAIAAASVLTREALRPLAEVTRALERFSDGDFTPEMVAADGDRQLGALALAYNGAVEQVELAFAERARASALMRQFFADAGHQFRTPLTVIRGFISILRKDAVFGDAERMHILAAMAQQTTLMSALVDKLILLDSWELEGEHAAAAPVNVGKIVADIVEPIALASDERKISVSSGPGACVLMQPGDLEHAIANIVDNAVKYTAGDVDVSVTANDRVIEVSIADKGPGMNAEQAARAFDRFYRGTRRDVEGSGLGLSIAQRVAERAGGSIELRSDSQEGTLVRLTLPRCMSPDATANGPR